MSNPAQSFYTWYKNTLEHPKYRWVLVGATLLYLLSPIDISPTLFPSSAGLTMRWWPPSLSPPLPNHADGLNQKRTDLSDDANAANTTVDVNSEA